MADVLLLIVAPLVAMAFSVGLAHALYGGAIILLERVKIRKRHHPKDKFRITADYWPGLPEGVSRGDAIEGPEIPSRKGFR